MNKFTSEMVDKYASDLLIGLTEEENKMVLDEFEMIDKNIDIINTIDGIKSLEPMTHALDDFIFELREDEASDAVATSDALRNAGNVEGQEIIVPKVVD